MLMNSVLRLTLIAILWLSANVAQAHTGHGAGDFSDGLIHPFLGVDHLLAMVAVGTWSCLVLSARQRIAGPLVFMSMLTVGAVLAPAGLVSAVVEPGVAFTVILLGGLLLAGKHLNSAIGLTLIGAAAMLHGLAHGTELLVYDEPMSTPFMDVLAGSATLVGMLLGSAILHGLGYLAGTQLLSAPRWVHHSAAAGLGLAGLVMLITRL